MAAELNIPVCMMHMQGEPRTMQQNPQYQNVVADIKVFFKSRIKAAISAGIKKEHILIDPGFGFGKSLQHNLSLLKHLAQFSELGHPVLVGMSRKSMIGLVTGKEVTQRLAGSIAVATIAALNGAQIIRVHDVAATVDALKMVEAVTQAE
jgi:dihydropteroate synthase